jgi:hypothetical protein
VVALGKGKVAAIYFDFSEAYLKNRSAAFRGFLIDVVRRVFPKPKAEVTGSSNVDVVVNRIGGKLAINLVNTSGAHASEPITEAIDPVGPLGIVIRQERKPVKVTLEPGGHPIAFQFESGEVRLTLTKVEVHEIVVVE